MLDGQMGRDLGPDRRADGDVIAIGEIDDVLQDRLLLGGAGETGRHRL